MIKLLSSHHHGGGKVRKHLGNGIRERLHLLEMEYCHPVLRAAVAHYGEVMIVGASLQGILHNHLHTDGMGLGDCN